MPLLQTRGPMHGRCNICGIQGLLTEDHTPPKGYAPSVPVQMTHIADRLRSEPQRKFRKAPDGVKYRTLCASCNNGLLGSEYDGALIRMARQATSVITSEMLLPPTVALRVMPQRVVRSVLGHIAAQGVDRYEKGPITEPLRDYLLNSALPMLAGVRLCYWIYPHRPRVLIRDAAIMHLFEGAEHSSCNHSVIWLMKCFPLAFAVLWDGGFKFENGAPQPRDFDAYTNMRIDDEVDLPIDLFGVPHELWPEAPTDGTALMLGQEAVSATVSPTRGKVLKLR
jgi:hypothetical protein